jgi:hypothetical protein
MKQISKEVPMDRNTSAGAVHPYNLKEEQSPGTDYPELFLKPKTTCSSNNTIIIYVLSTIEGQGRRDVIRNTWGNVSLWNTMARNPFHVELFFVIGTSGHSWLRDFARLEEENRHRGDLLIGDVTDSYFNLTNKGIVALKWISDKCSNDNIAFVFKTDDDVFMNIPVMIARMKHSQKSGKNCHFLCNCLRNVKVPREGKWTITRDLYAEDLFPKFCQGIGYAICPNGLKLLQRYFPVVQRTPFPLEDVFITSLALRRHIGDAGLDAMKYESVKHVTISQNLENLKDEHMHQYIMMHQVPLEVYQDLHEVIMIGLKINKPMVNAFHKIYMKINSFAEL